MIYQFWWHFSYCEISVLGTFQFWWHFSFDLDPPIWTCLFRSVCLTQFVEPIFLDPSIWTRLFGPVYLDLSIWSRLFRPVNLDPDIWTKIIALDPSIWTRLFGPVYLDPSIWTCLFGPVYLDPFLVWSGLVWSGLVWFGQVLEKCCSTANGRLSLEISAYNNQTTKNHLDIEPFRFFCWTCMPG